MDLVVLKGIVRALARAGRRPKRGAPLPARGKVLILRHDRIGDALLSTCVLDSLARHRPEWQLHVLLGHENRRVLENHPAVTRHWCYDRRPGSALALVRALRAQRFDLAVDLMNHPSLTSMVFLRLARPRLAAGFEEEQGYAFDLEIPAPARRSTHIVERLGELLRALGCPVTDASLKLRYSPAEASRARAREFLEPRRAAGLKLCGVNTSAGSPRRFWGEDNYRAFLESAARAGPGHRFVVFALPVEAARARRVASGIEGAEVAPPTDSFDEFAALLGGMDTVITPDTSVVHLAAAFGIPAVVLFGDEHKARVWAPWGVEHRSLIAPGGDFRGIAPGEVLAAWRSLPA